MSKKWLYEMRCERCNAINVFYVFDGATDRDIAFLRSQYQENPFRIEYCGYCEKDTLHKWLSIYPEEED